METQRVQDQKCTYSITYCTKMHTTMNQLFFSLSLSDLAAGVGIRSTGRGAVWDMKSHIGLCLCVCDRGITLKCIVSCLLCLLTVLCLCVSIYVPVDDMCVVARQKLCERCVYMCIVKHEQCRVSTQPAVEEEMTASQQASGDFSASKPPASTY